MATFRASSTMVEDQNTSDVGSASVEDGGQDGSDEECYLRLVDGDDFDENDSDFKLTEPDRYENLDDLPGADESWTDEADSARAGRSAAVTVYSEKNFEGSSCGLKPGTDHPDLDPERSSLEMSCD